MDLALNNLQRLICHKTQSTNQPTAYGKEFRHIHKWIFKILIQSKVGNMDFSIFYM